MNLGDKLQDAYTNLNSVLTDINANLVEKGADKVDNFKDIPNGIKKIPQMIEDELFRTIADRTISEITNKDVELVGIRAFMSCTRLTTADFPACKTVSAYAFANCSSLTTVSFPVCKTVSTYAFRYCTSLTTANFPACTSIGTYAFNGCNKLTSLILANSSMTTLSNINAFYSTPMSTSSYTGTFGSIYVPASLVDAYKSATNWATYAARITSIPE